MPIACLPLFYSIDCHSHLISDSDDRPAFCLYLSRSHPLAKFCKEGGLDMQTARERKGLDIAAQGKIERSDLGWTVPSQSGSHSYRVSLADDGPSCTCPDFEAMRQPCKHIYAVKYWVSSDILAIYSSDLNPTHVARLLQHV